MTIFDTILNNHTDAIERGARLSDEAAAELEKARTYKHRTNYIAPAYPGDMSQLNAVLNTIADE